MHHGHEHDGSESAHIPSGATIVPEVERARNTYIEEVIDRISIADRDPIKGDVATDLISLHLHDASEPWETLPDYQRAKHRRGVRAMLDELERVEAVHLARHKREARNTIAVRRAG